MKTVSKFFGLIALCAAAFASCQKEQVFEEDQLSDAVEEGGTRATKGTTDSNSITFMTYNVAACKIYEKFKSSVPNKNPTDVFSDIAKIIKDNKVDYVSLNEVDYCNTHRIVMEDYTSDKQFTYTPDVHGLDQLQAIAKRADMSRAYYGPTCYVKKRTESKLEVLNERGNYGEVGNGILYPKRLTNNELVTIPSSGGQWTRYKDYLIHSEKSDYKNGTSYSKCNDKIKVRMLKLPNCGEANRGLIVLETEKCVFASTHLGESLSARQQQFIAITDFIFNNYYKNDKNDKNDYYSNKPIILCGDFNTSPRDFAKITKDSSNNKDYSKAWKVISKTNQNTFHGSNSACLDYICLFKNQFFTDHKDSYCIDSKIIDGASVFYLSDHNPVITTLSW